MKYLLAILCLAAFVPGSAGVADTVASPDVYDEDPYFLLMGEADEAIAAQNWPEACARLCDALAVKPDAPTNVMLLSNLGMVYSCMGRDSLALDTYERALRQHPRMSRLLLGKAGSLLALGRAREAYLTYGKVIEADSLSTRARYTRGMMALQTGDTATAARDFRVLETVAPKSTDTALALGLLYARTARYKQAVPYLERVLTFDASPEFFIALASCHLNLGQLTEASAVLSDAMAAYPDDPGLLYCRAWLNRDRYLLDAARADAARAIALGADPALVNALFKAPKAQPPAPL